MELVECSRVMVRTWHCHVRSSYLYLTLLPQSKDQLLFRHGSPGCCNYHHVCMYSVLKLLYQSPSGVIQWTWTWILIVMCTRNAIQMQYCIFEPLGGKLSVFRVCETQLSSTKQEIGLDVDTVVPHYDSKLNCDVKVYQTIVVIKGR